MIVCASWKIHADETRNLRAQIKAVRLHAAQRRRALRNRAAIGLSLRDRPDGDPRDRRQAARDVRAARRPTAQGKAPKRLTNSPSYIWPGFLFGTRATSLDGYRGN